VSPTLLLLAIFAASDAEAPVVHAKSRTFVLLGARPYYSTADDRLVDRRALPIVEELTVDARTGIPGVTVAVDAWLAVEGADRFLQDRALGDLGEAWVRLEREELTLTAGRMMIASTTGRGIRIDGARFFFHPRGDLFGAKIRAEIWGGVPVEPSFGEEPLRRSVPIFADDPLQVAKGSTDWDRPGDWAIAGSVGLLLADLADASIGYVRVQDLTEVGREALVGTVDLLPGQRITVRAFGSFDVYGKGVEEAEVEASLWATEDLRLAVFGRHTSPELLLPSTSILSVFGGPTHSDAGLDADLYLSAKVRLSASAELRRAAADEDALGHRLSASILGLVPGLDGARANAGFERVDDLWYGGYEQAHLGIEIPLSETLAVGADGALFVFRRDEASQLAARGGISSRLDLGRWRISWAARLTRIEDLSTDLSMLGKVEWDIGSF
jgi:hypothetical protein